MMTRHANRLLSLFSAALVVLAATMPMSPASAVDSISSGQAEARMLLAADTQVSSKGKEIRTEGNRVIIIGGCPYNLDRVCTKNKRGKLVNCRCQS
jgi:hypothetical protein